MKLTAIVVATAALCWLGSAQDTKQGEQKRDTKAVAALEAELAKAREVVADLEAKLGKAMGKQEVLALTPEANVGEYGPINALVSVDRIIDKEKLLVYFRGTVRGLLSRDFQQRSSRTIS